MIILWTLLYWVIGIVIMTIIDKGGWLYNNLDDGDIIIGSIMWPLILIVIAFIGFYWLIHTGVEKLVDWFMK